MKTFVLLFKLSIFTVFILTLAACGVQTRPASTLPSNMGQAVVTLPDHDKPLEVTYEIVDGNAMFEGDINLGRVDENGKLREANLAPQGVGIEGRNFRWPSGIIFFTTDSNLDATMVTRINDAIAHWRQNTSFTFLPVPSNTPVDRVTFTAGSGCSSDLVGRLGGQQFVRLSTACTTGNIIHEIGHVVGLWHEQSRADRDEFVDILFGNVEAGFASQFAKHVTDGFDSGRYDFNSIMHYPATAFGKLDAFGNRLTTIITKPAGIAIGQRVGLSAGDIAAANRLFPRDNGTFNVTNGQVPNFASWASASYAKLIPGDFNGDKKQDFALLRKTGGFTDIPVAFSSGNGSFTVTTGQAPTFAAWASGFAVQIIPGNFNNDSCTDLALVNGAPGWASIPVAFSNCNGTFTVTNQQVSNPVFDFPLAAADILVKIIPQTWHSFAKQQAGPAFLSPSRMGMEPST
jgi:Astacin (Peptidase family M12A)